MMQATRTVGVARRATAAVAVAVARGGVVAGSGAVAGWRATAVGRIPRPATRSACGGGGGLHTLVAQPVHSRDVCTPIKCSVRLASTESSADTQFVMPGGLKKFFPENAAWDEVDVGRRWKTRELRVKSNEDLHKLWYILLIERNKLLTVKLEARRLGEEMPGPLRLKKVKQAMTSIQHVLRERMHARKTAIQTDIDAWAALRAQEGLAPTSTVYRRPPPRPLTASEGKRLHGIMPPNRSRPGQPERPLKKRERTMFRKRLQRTRHALARKGAKAYADRLARMSNDQVRQEMDVVALELLQGANLKTLTLTSQACLKEARARGISPL